MNESLNHQLESVREVGQADRYAGNRSWVRYQADLPLELRFSQDGAIETARLHNISGGGIGVWSPKPVPNESDVWVRLSDEYAWLPGHVAQSTEGSDGYLLGIRLRDPLPPDHDTTDQLAARHINERERRARQSRMDSTFAAALIILTACLPLFGPTWLAAQPWAREFIGLASPAFVILAGLCGLVALRLATRADQRFERSLAHTLTGIARGHQTEAVPWAPSASARLLRRSVIRFRDTLRQREVNETQRRQKLEEITLVKSNILSMVSHDLRTPLTSILLYSQMLREDLDTLPVSDQQQFLTIISSECTRLTRLVDDLLEAQRLDSGRTKWKMEQVDLAEPICNCADVFVAMAQAKRIELTIECPEHLPPIEADADKVAQVLSNLLSNAVKYTTEGGRIQLDVSNTSEELLIRVSDNGPGIPRDQWDQIFDRFSQLSATQYVRDIPGVGLGLFIVRQIVERHGGRVWVESEPDKGSCFSVALPIQREAADPTAADENHLARVVVCDADPEAAMRIAQTLRANRYAVRLAHSACRLLSHVEQGDVDVVLTDIMLPDMDVPDLIDALSDRGTRGYRIVTHSFAGDVADLRSRGVDVVLQRPASTNDLLQAVRTASHAGRHSQTVLVVGNDGWRAELLRHGIAQKGWLPIIVDNVGDAKGFLGRFPIDLLLVTQDELFDGTLTNLTQNCPDVRCVVVARQRPKATMRRLAERDGFELLVHRPGEETELLERIARDGEATESSR